MSENQTNFMDKMAAKAEELELQKKASDLADAVSKLAQSAFDQAKSYTADHRDQVEGFLDKAAAKVDETTDGKYHDKVAKAREAASNGVSKFTDAGASPAAGATAATAAGTEATAAPPAPSWASDAPAEPTFDAEPVDGVGTDETATPQAWKDATDEGPKA